MRLTVTVPPWARHVVSDRTDMDRAPRAIDPSKVRRYTLHLPDDVYFEYAFLDEYGEMRADPERPERADNPWYPSVTAVRGPNYHPHPLAHVDDALATGTMERLRIPTRDGAERRASLYTPTGLEGPAPLLVVHDGTAFQRIARLPALLETLTRDARIQPARLAFLDPRTPSARREEYGFGEAYQHDLAHAVLPTLREKAQATTTLWMGASLGGLAALLASLDQPESVSGIALHSAALLGTPEDRTFHGTERSWMLEHLAERTASLPWRIYQEVGTLDWLHDVNVAAAPHFARLADAHHFTTRNAGHNWTFWRDGVADALTFLLTP